MVGKAACSHFKHVAKQKGASQAFCCHKRGLPRVGLVGVSVGSFFYPLGDYSAFEEVLK